MNVIFGKEHVEEFADRYTLLELDTIIAATGMDPVTNYAVIGPDDLPLEKFANLKHMLPLHEALLKNYKIQNWDFCQQAIAELNNQICPFMDEFYTSLNDRVTRYTANPPREEWTSAVTMGK